MRVVTVLFRMGVIFFATSGGRGGGTRRCDKFAERGFDFGQGVQWFERFSARCATIAELDTC